MSKRTLMMVVALVAALALATTGTLAYLTDTDSDVNIMTLGNVDIEQIELQRSENYKQNYDSYPYEVIYGDLEEYVDGLPLYPAFPHPDAEYFALSADPVPYKDYVTATDDAADEIWYNNDLKGVRDKFVFVKNTGSSDAYVRTLLAFEHPAGITYGTPEEAATADLLLNLTDDPAIKWEEYGDIEVNGKTYLLMSATYVDALEPGKIARPSLLQVAMSDKCGNEEVALLGTSYDILVLSQAIQVENLNELTDDPAAAADAALNTGFGAVSKETAEKWFGENPESQVTEIKNPSEINDALEQGGTMILPGGEMEVPADSSNAYGSTAIVQSNGGSIVGNGAVIKAPEAGGTWDSAITTSGGSISDLTVAEGFRGIFVKNNTERVYLNDVTADGTTYTISCDQGGGAGLTATNSTFNGWTSYAATIGDVIFNNCSFGEGSGYAYCRPYAPTQFINCDFEADFTVDPRANIVMENCRLDGVEITSANLDQLVTNTSKVTIK